MAHIFTVNAQGKQVMFSPGNLYWDGTQFKFETHQYDYPTEWNANHVGHFFWSKDAAIARAASYNDPSAADADKFFAANGGAIEGYTVLSKDEWQYLIDHALVKVSGNPKVVAIDGKNCVVLAPDGFSGTVADSYTAAEWVTAEASGLVALPFAGYRHGTGFSRVDSYGYYWSASPYHFSDVCGAYFYSGAAGMSISGRIGGYSVRLVSVYHGEKLFHSGLVATLRDWIRNHFTDEAPVDDKQYARKNRQWSEVAGGGGLEQYPTQDDFPEVGDESIGYVAIDTNGLYRWDAATETYIYIGSKTWPTPGPETSNGIYIKYTDGTISPYDTLVEGKTPVGVALINNDENVRLVMHPLEGQAIWQAPAVSVPGATTSNSKTNTDAILALRETNSCPAAVFAREGCIYADGSEGQLPSMDVMEMFLANATQVNTAMALIGGTGIARSRNCWSSNNYDASHAWRWNSSDQTWGGSGSSSSKSISYAVRSVAAF